MVRPCSKNGRRKITQNSIEVDAETKESTRKTEKKNWMEGIRKAMNERNLNEGQWKDRKQLLSTIIDYKSVKLNRKRTVFAVSSTERDAQDSAIRGARL